MNRKLNITTRQGQNGFKTISFQSKRKVQSS